MEELEGRLYMQTADVPRGTMFPMREILWYHLTHGAALFIVPALAPLFVFFPYSIVMIAIIMKDFMKKHKKEIRKDNKHK